MAIFKHPIKESINNLLLRLKAFKLYKKTLNGSRGIMVPQGYGKVFGDDFEGKLDTNKWRYGQPWGNFHPEYLNQHYDLKGKDTFISKFHGLVLRLRRRVLKVVQSDLPKWKHNKSLPSRFIIPYSVGLITSKKSWKYGWFSAEIKLPSGKNLWPAFWLCGENSWPPEIDIFEGYTKDSDDYEGKFLFKKRPHVRIQPNLHYGDLKNDTKAQYGPKNVPVYNATNRYVQYVCWWEEDFIRIYYDGMKVFECTNPEVLKWFNKENAQQYIVLNNGAEDKQNPSESEMYVKNVKVYQRKVT